MKELTIEQKAKAYDEAIAAMRKCETDKYGCVIGVKPSDLFHELIESDDEESKKWIMEYLYDGMRHSDEQYKGQFKSAIAWLDKQGENGTNGNEREIPNSAWSEEDEGEFVNIVDFLNSPSTAELCPTLRTNALNWLKSIKERIRH